MKPKKTTKTFFTPTEVGTLIERLEGNFKLFGEKLDSLEENLTARIDGIAANQARTLERITAIEIRLTMVEERLTSVEERLTSEVLSFFIPSNAFLSIS